MGVGEERDIWTVPANSIYDWSSIDVRLGVGTLSL